VDPDEVRREVLDAIRRGEIISGGPSEIAAYDLLDDVPAGYWARWSGSVVDRIRREHRKS
jgi:hypothetical protein